MFTVIKISSLVTVENMLQNFQIRRFAAHNFACIKKTETSMEPDLSSN